MVSVSRLAVAMGTGISCLVRIIGSGLRTALRQGSSRLAGAITSVATFRSGPDSLVPPPLEAQTPDVEKGVTYDNEKLTVITSSEISTAAPTSPRSRMLLRTGDRADMKAQARLAVLEQEIQFATLSMTMVGHQLHAFSQDDVCARQAAANDADVMRDTYSDITKNLDFLDSVAYCETALHPLRVRKLRYEELQEQQYRSEMREASMQERIRALEQELEFERQERRRAEASLAMTETKSSLSLAQAEQQINLSWSCQHRGESSSSDASTCASPLRRSASFSALPAHRDSASSQVWISEASQPEASLACGSRA